MIKLALMAMLGAFVSWLVSAWVQHHAEKYKLVQEVNLRSSHVKPTPTGGGLGIVLTSTALGIVLVWEQPFQLLSVMGLALTLALVGLADDVFHIKARLRFVVHTVVCAVLLTLLGNMPQVALFSSIGLDGLSLFGLLLLIGIWWLNLFNFMDGIDGIAGVQAVCMLLTGVALAGWANPSAISSPTWMLMICIASATVGFLFLNWPPATIFMGDVGSTWLAFMIFALGLLTVKAGWLTYTVWMILGAVFVTDATITLINRIGHGERWYEAHRVHAYQRLSRRWRGDRDTGHRSVTLLVAATNMFWLSPLACACLLWPQWALVWIIMAYTPLIAGVIALGAGKPDHA